MSGWLKISREINNHWIWGDEKRLKWWIDILLVVNYEDKKVLIHGTLYDCKRGESLMSLTNWGKRWGVSKTAVNNFFELLKKDGMITTKNETQTTRLTVCKYDTYQGKENARRTQEERKEERRLATTKEDKELKELKEGKEGVFKKFAHLSIFKSEYDSLSLIYTAQKVDSILDSIENYSKNTSYKSLYLTAKKWLETDAKKEPKTQTTKVPYIPNPNRITSEQKIANWEAKQLLEKQKANENSN